MYHSMRACDLGDALYGERHRRQQPCFTKHLCNQKADARAHNSLAAVRADETPRPSPSPTRAFGLPGRWLLTAADNA
jgi:hypothetical protein